jgi:serpin B
VFGLQVMKVTFLLIPVLACLQWAGAQPEGAPSVAAAVSVNQFGVDLHRWLAKGQPTGNLLISPLSLHIMLAMTSAGAAGETYAEMARVLHLPNQAGLIHQGHASLIRLIDESAVQAREIVESRNQALVPYREKDKAAVRNNLTTELPELHLANAVFGQKQFAFRPAYVALLREQYRADLQTLDYVKEPDSARDIINAWVADHTQRKIIGLLPAGALRTNTCLVLASALYFKAPWDFKTEFPKADTKPLPFKSGGESPVDVATMTTETPLGYRAFPDFSAVTISYCGGDLHLLILLPDEVDGLPKLEARLDRQLLQDCAGMEPAMVRLYLPKLRIAGASIALESALKALGMVRAFAAADADFTRMATPGPLRNTTQLHLDQVRHQTILLTDEQGAEAAAASFSSRLQATTSNAIVPPKRVTVRVDHPFLFAIQHKPTGVCLFLGRVVDPR